MSSTIWPKFVGYGAAASMVVSSPSREVDSSIGGLLITEEGLDAEVWTGARLAREEDC